METPWFASWFDSNFYHTLYQHRDETEAERFIQSLVAHLSPAPGTRVLDLACGRGRHARQLHSLGMQVLGVDLSPASIADANKEAKDGLAFKVQDMRDPFPGKFGLILNLFTSFGYFENTSDNRKVLENVAEALEPNGVFVLDFMNVEKVLRNLVPAESKEMDGVFFEISRALEDGVIVKRIHVNDNGMHEDYAERVQALGRDELEEMMMAAGLELTETWGGYDGAAFDPAHSDRLVMFARHKG